MNFLSSITSFFGSIPWVKIGFFAAIASGIVYGVHVIKLSGEQSVVIKTQQEQMAEQQRENAAAIQQLKDQYKRDMEAIQKEKDDAVIIAKSTQEQLDRIKHSPSSGDGLTRPVLSDTLSWMRNHSAGDGNTNPEGKSASGTSVPNPSP